MLEFIHFLKQRYQDLLIHLNDKSLSDIYQQRIDQLILSEAFIRKGQLSECLPQQLLQVAIIGPTQAGKSSLANTLLNSNLAGVSPLAGYTVHPQGFCNGVAITECNWLQRYFGRFQQLQLNQLSKNRYDCYALIENSTISSLLPICVLWDTPDFDSIDAENYREGVLRTLALADIIILVVSKEKYADQSVWNILSDLEALHQPTIICLNKLSEDSEALIVNSLKDKWTLARKDDFPEIVTLFYQKPSGLPSWPASKKSLIQELASNVVQPLKGSKSKHARYEQLLLQKYWATWIEPVIAEHQAFDEWQELVDTYVKQALSNYQRDFLDHPHHYETFQQSLAELLTLLEIPGLAGILTNTRKILTWPARQFSKFSRNANKLSSSNNEITLLNQIAGHVIIQIADTLISKTENHKSYKELNVLLRSQKSDILNHFNIAAVQYHVTFQQEVVITARRLYQKLKEQPIVLNSLRATRATTDAAAIAFAIHSGGLGMQDLILAPAMFTVTSLLAESAIGGYMRVVEGELKQSQLKTVKQLLFNDVIRTRLLKLPEQLSPSTHFNISPDQLHSAEKLIAEKKHGLRLL
jgi:hypothetical protein